MTTIDQLNADGHTELDIPVRKMGFKFDVTIPKHYINNKAYETHFFNGLQLLFPEGERFFMKAVRDRLDRVEHSNLQKQAKGFFGQEAQHAFEHDAFNEVLAQQGYSFQAALKKFNDAVNRGKKRLPSAYRLAITAGGEHFTAVMGRAIFKDNDVENTHPTMRSLIKWHAMEEIEHKAVAFDVLKLTNPSYFLRAIGFISSYIVIVNNGRMLTHQLLRQDGYSRSQIRQMKIEFDAAWKQKHPEFNRKLLEYFKPNFHPFQTDERSLLAEAKLSLGLK